MKGALGISGTATLYKEIKPYFFLIGVLLVLLTLFIVQNLVHSRSGRAVMSTRDNRIAAESVGINVTKYKLLAFTVSAALQVWQACFMPIIFPCSRYQYLITICQF